MTAEAGAVAVVAALRRVTAAVVEAGVATAAAEAEVAAVPAVEVAGSGRVAAGDIADRIPDRTRNNKGSGRNDRSLSCALMARACGGAERTPRPRPSAPGS